MAKYDTLRKLERNKMLGEYARLHPELSLAEIGRAFNITPSRVCRILNSLKKAEEENKVATAKTVAT